MLAVSSFMVKQHQRGSNYKNVSILEIPSNFILKNSRQPLLTLFLSVYNVLFKLRLCVVQPLLQIKSLNVQCEVYKNCLKCVAELYYNTVTNDLNTCPPTTITIIRNNVGFHNVTLHLITSFLALHVRIKSFSTLRKKTAFKTFYIKCQNCQTI